MFWHFHEYDLDRSERSHRILSQINPIISWSIRSNVSNNSTVSDLMSPFDSYLCSILIWSNRIVVDVVSFKDTIKKTLKIGLFVSGHQEPSSDAAVFNTKELIESNIKKLLPTFIDWAIKYENFWIKLASIRHLLQNHRCMHACISLPTLGIVKSRFSDISDLDA